MTNTTTTAPAGVWPAALATTAVLGSLAAACMLPFVALATVAAATMSTRRAMATVAAVWVINQIVGYTLMGYPLVADTYGWGVAIGVSALAATGIARGVLGQSRDLAALRLVGAFALAFVGYEALLLGYAQVAGGLETFAAPIVAQIALNDALWFAGLVALRLALTSVAPRWFGAVPALRIA